MSENLLTSIITTWGLFGCLGVAGCYLIVGSIVGQLLVVPPIVKEPLKVNRKPQRVLLGFFGLVLAFPVVLMSWERAFGFSTTLGDPKIEDEVKPTERTGGPPSHELNIRDEYGADRGAMLQAVSWERTAGLTSLAAPAKFSPSEQPQAGGCDKVESFGLEEYHARQLKYDPFQRGAYVYVGDIRAFGDTDLYLAFGKPGFLPDSGKISESEFDQKAGPNKKHLGVGHSGASVDFEDHGNSYRLTVTNIYLSIFGTNKIAVSICEMK
jgi:hypothetical protein